MNVLKYEVLAKMYGINEELIKKISNKIIFNYCIDEVVERIYCGGSAYADYYDICDILYINKDEIIYSLRKAINKGILFFNEELLSDFEISCKNHSLKQFFSTIEKEDLESFFRICFIELEEFVYACDEVHKSLKEESLNLNKVEYDEIFINELNYFFKTNCLRRKKMDE